MKAIVLAACLVCMSNGAEYVVVVSKKSSFGALSVSQIRDVFLQKRRSLGEQKTIPVNVLGHDEVRAAFESRVLGMDRNRLNAYWVKQHFQGVTPPLTQPSFESVKAFVENVEGAIGYLPGSMVDAKVKAVYEF
ncbi:hypothetical protein E0765_01515 [Sulfuricurvum sp. IAE1]|jgi:hypothetical protein|uniref:hypothetical protein n=1 Tax=Sulfuricurvum sp. IAE1 TaxID=2546102 RepID=UPI00104BF389|nr:hypothetical protein [Sulfuricurvum sp. IAE1]MDX9967154.1 hypothetical protein [Sulfuricurvum sp.]TDA69122.1 hypothetical protein E0765_01515 [Sulfuricurvum sp. IAE1]